MGQWGQWGRNTEINFAGKWTSSGADLLMFIFVKFLVKLFSKWLRGLGQSPKVCIWMYKAKTDFRRAGRYVGGIRKELLSPDLCYSAHRNLVQDSGSSRAFLRAGRPFFKNRAFDKQGQLL
jgi:hypothetical protein